MDKLTKIRKQHVNKSDDWDLWDQLIATQNDKVEWTTAFINTLPDAAFAIILPGGEKDEEGKTTPRDLRKLPHHDSTVTNPNDDESVDIPHLNNALARVNQLDATDAQIAEARAHLEAHQERIQAEEEEE